MNRQLAKPINHSERAAPGDLRELVPPAFRMLKSDSGVRGDKMTIYCSQCGTALPPSARFCSRCGVPLPSAPPFTAHPLVRPRIGRQAAGVCIALARAYGWDVAVVRILTVIGLCCSGGLVGVAYLACWIGIPEEPLGNPGEYPPVL